ncbi:ALP1-like protein isoform X1 [Tanacetum coccineum]
MNRSLFTRIVRDLSANCLYFQEGCDAVEKLHLCFRFIGEEYLRRLRKLTSKNSTFFTDNKHGFLDDSVRAIILLERLLTRFIDLTRPFFGVAVQQMTLTFYVNPVLNDLKVGKAPEVSFVANDVTYKWGYYLTDGIYPK